MRRRVLAGILLAVLLTGAALAVLLSLPITVRGDGFVYIPRGTSARAAIDSVAHHADLPSPTIMGLTARLASRVSGRSVQAGWHRLRRSMTSLELVEGLMSGSLRPVVRVTLPEGLTFTEMASIVHRRLETDSAAFVSWCENDSVCRTYDVAGPTMEGYLMPETYDFHWREAATDVGDRLARQFRAVWRRSVEGRLAEAGWERHALVTLASIVRAETANEAEATRIAGVYRNRLARTMRLEADPTVQYALGARRRLRYRDLETADPYNTYRHTGLPPGPINNPGLASIRACLEAEDHDYLFFVAVGDASGRHRFARTGTEHLRNVALYRRTRAAR